MTSISNNAKITNNQHNCETFSIVSLGCPKNLVDSERYVRQMREQGYEFQIEPDGSDVVVLNTCGFLQSARDEAREYIRGLIDLKKEGRIKRIIVRGCMTQFEGIKQLAVEFPDVDEWFGVPVIDSKNIAINTTTTTNNIPLTVPQNQDQNLNPDISSSSNFDLGRDILTADHVAYLRIADGCSRRCSFCTIPDIRGQFRSETKDKLLTEAKQLAQSGVKELVIIAQETTFWGMDLPERYSLIDLLRCLEGVDGIRWIRLMYAYPGFFDDELAMFFSRSEKLLPYIDIPLQHINDDILRRMNRSVTRAETERLLDKLRNKIERLVLRTSLIVGFPGETDAMFDELVRFVDKWKFERAGVFAFSAEPRTPAAKFQDKIPNATIERRFRQLNDLCNKNAIAWGKRQKNNIMSVQIDGNYIDDSGYLEPNLYIGRTYADAPDIDPIVYVTNKNNAKLEAGSLVNCEILETEGNNLVGIVA
ncbi:MAG: 30S ribosomal protein S12 methylthiotransferase RimO [Planctomycetaceae bacterium]|jgi:ribosomal protein S12 methylthiotransferase|nr:30S ribosomal protein S12 methylthiotransferase RimO [Planctomycetaceae bacterium]